MTKNNWIIGGAVALVVLVILFFQFDIPNKSWIPTPDYETAYRLVPEKISRSAAITVSVPEASGVNAANLSTQVTFTPSISGHWVDEKTEKSVSFVGVAHAAENIKTYYFQPNQSLDENRHYAVTVASPNTPPLTADFLVVADPEILSILPSTDEVLTNTKISIVFNRPMVPLSTIDEMSGDNLPVTISPATSGKWKWISTHTLQFIPTTKLISSTDYTVTVSAGLKSMEGLPVKPQKSTFSTYHLRFVADDNEQNRGSYNNQNNQNVVRGYNQPFLIRFNQPIDLDATAKMVTVDNGSQNIRFTAKYWKTKKSDASRSGSDDEGLMGAVYNSLFNTAATADSKETEVEDQTMLAIYPEGGESGNWEPGTNYNVTVAKAYPKSGGNITTTDSRRFTFAVDDIVARAESVSTRASQSFLDQFDPMGKLQIVFYEPIDLTKSRISAPGLDAVVYGEKCKSDTQQSCVKEPDHLKILVSFKNNSLKPSESVPVVLEKIVSDTGRLLTSRPFSINLKVYEPFVIYKVVSGDSLNSIIVCSNNPLPQQKADTTESSLQKVTSNPSFGITGWHSSFKTNEYSNNGCEQGQFVTGATSELLPGTHYTGSVVLTDAFGGTATKGIDFISRNLRAEDYDLKSFQASDVVTVPDKTKLSFGARYLPEITATVCSMKSYDYYKVRNNSTVDAGYLCQSSVSKTITLPTNKAGQTIFTVDIKDFFPNAIGNYMVRLSSPLISREDRGWDPTRTFVSVTNLIVTEKKITPTSKSEYESLTLTGDQLSKLQNLYWVIDATTRQPIMGATISTYVRGSVVSSTLTDNKGLAFLTPVVGAETTIATVGSDSVVVSENAKLLTYASDAANIKHLYLYTDKPLYRPGQEVNLKGIYRFGYDGYYEVPPHQTLSLKVYDSAQKVISEQELVTNGYGTVAATITLDAETPLGSYRACVEYNCSYFDVLNYVPAAFRVTFDDKEQEIFAGSSPKVDLKADYYFGVPLSNATVNYRLSSQYYYFDKYTTEYFAFNNLYSDNQSSRYYYGDRYLGSGDAVLDENGEVTLKPDLSQANQESDTSKIIILDATVKNQQGRSIGAQKSFILHAAPIYIGTQIKESFVPTGQPISLRIKTVNTQGEQVGLGGIKVQTYRVKWVANERDSGGGGTYTTWTRERELVKTDDARTDSDGNATATLNPSGEGEYEVDVISGQKGAAVGSRSWFYVYGRSSVSVRSSDDTNLNVVSNTDNLKVGDVGEVIFEVPEGSAKALVTIERGRIFSYEVIDVVGSIAHYKFPVLAAHYPNVYVSVVAYAPGHEVRIGNKRFVVDSDQKKIKLSVTSDKPIYNPGDVVNLSLTATDDAGKPLASEVSVAVVDMSVLALKGNPKKDLLPEFYGNVPLTVSTYSNFRNLLKYEEQKMADGKGGSGGDPNSSKRRGVFKEVAFWKPNVLTDATGHATVTFTLPDNLTTWQAEAIAVTSDTKVGAAYNEFTTNKTLMVTPLKPRFALPGDSFMMGATVFNRSNTTFDGTVTMKVPALELGGKNAQGISIAAGQSKTLYWDVRVPLTQKPGVVTYSIDATGSGLADAVDDTLSIKTNTTYETVATAGQTETSTSEAVYLPGSITKDQGGLTLRSSATLAVFMTDALNYLVAYPYGCTEQIASQIRAIALIKRAHNIPGVPNPLSSQTVVYNEKEYTVDQLIQEGLKTIYGRQNTDGGFNYWSSDRQSSYWATREAVDAFRVLSESGVTVDEVRWQRAATYLYNSYTSSSRTLSNSEFIELAEALFTRPDYRSNSGLQQTLDTAVRQLLRDRKSPTGTVLAASRLLHRYNMSLDLARQLDQVLKNKVVVDARGSFIDVSAGGSYVDTAISNTTGYIDLLVARHEKDAQLPDLLRWLLASREKDGAWGTTLNTLSVVEAMSDYLEWQPETSANFTMKNSLNGTSVQEFSFTPQTILTQVVTEVPLTKLSSGNLNTVNFAKTDATAPGKIYYDMSFKYYLPAQELPPRDEGMTVKRGMYTLADIRSENNIEKTKVGEVVREHLEITVPVTRRNVLIEDFIPAGMEIVDTNLATEDQSVRAVEKEVKSSRLWPSHKEIRDDRYMLVIDELAPGTYTFDYFLRALTPGTYTHLPAQASESYNPENFGRTETGLFSVEK
ncbi:MAG: alpha-2-macroglobulin family protein [Patescibacteria group bacterium]